MPTIDFSQLPQIPPSQVLPTSELAMNTTDANGVPYVGRVTLSDVLTQGGQTAQVFTKALTIPSAQVLTMDSTPVAFGLNVPAGYYVRPLSADLKCDFNSVAYTGATDIVIRYVGAPDFVMGCDDGLNFSVSRILPFGFAGGTATPTNSVILSGVDLQVEVVGGSISAGDSDITIYLTYMLIEE